MTWLDRAEVLLDTYAARLLLSLLIILSVLPLADLFADQGAPTLRALRERQLDLAFFAIFAPELIIRLAVFWRRDRNHRHRRREAVLLVLDTIAVVSFLPMQEVVDAPWVRLVRLSRMVLLLGYWGDMVRDLWAILMQRERRFQVAFVLISGLFLAFGGTVLFDALSPPDPGWDLDGDGLRDGFIQNLWWSFRQVQDPGNLEPGTKDGARTVLSLLLTSSGLVLLAFVIGIGTSAIEELMQRSRTRPLGMRGHSVIVGLSEHSHFLLEEFAEIYTKNRRVLRWAVLGPTDQPPDTVGDHLDAFSYRGGDPSRQSDLARVDISRAKRVLLLGVESRDPDAAVIAAILAVRGMNPHADLYPDMQHERSLVAARTAGGPRTHLVGSGSFVGNYIAQNLIYPGAYRLYRQLLTSQGCEIYTYIYTPEERERLLASQVGIESLDEVAAHAHAYTRFSVTLLGWFVAPDPDADVEVGDLDILLGLPGAWTPEYARGPDGHVNPRAVRGVIGISLLWDDVIGFARSLLGRAAIECAPFEEHDFDQLELCLPAPALRELTICGDSPRIPRVVTDLAAFYGPLHVRILLTSATRLRALKDEILEALARELPGTPIREESEGDSVDLWPQLEEGLARIHIEVVDRGDVTALIRNPAIQLDDQDALVFLPSAHDSDASDGQVALNCLRLSQLDQAGDNQLRAGLRVLGVVQDPSKGDLLEQRLDRVAGRERVDRFTIISSERVRHHFIVQNVFVHGLNTVYQQLFATQGPSICRLVPRIRTERVATATTAEILPSLPGDFSPWDLARHLLTRRGLVLMGLEVSRFSDVGGAAGGPDAERRVLLDPREFPPEFRVAWSDVRALYALGDGRAFLRRDDGVER